MFLKSAEVLDILKQEVSGNFSYWWKTKYSQQAKTAKNIVIERMSKSWKTFFEEMKKKLQIDFCDVLKVPWISKWVCPKCDSA